MSDTKRGPFNILTWLCLPLIFLFHVSLILQVSFHAFWVEELYLLPFIIPSLGTVLITQR